MVCVIFYILLSKIDESLADTGALQGAMLWTLVIASPHGAIFYALWDIAGSVPDGIKCVPPSLRAAQGGLFLSLARAACENVPPPPAGRTIRRCDGWCAHIAGDRR